MLGEHPMRKPGTNQLWLAVSCLVSVVVALQNTGALAGTEFSGGWLTGPLLSTAEMGAILFLLAFGVAFAHSRVAAGIGLAASLLCLPLYLYLIDPSSFYQILWPWT
jgi:hypothetical protein